MRQDIYYWKCDCPRPAAERATGFTAAKYADGGIEPAVVAACRRVLGRAPTALAALGCAGDHFAYRVEDGDRTLLFRAAADATGDDYMLAEGAAMALAAAAGVPVPALLHTEAEPGAPLRWQLMAWVAGESLRDLHRCGTLDTAATAAALGWLLRRLHRVPVEGFGCFDTAHLRATGRLRGLHPVYAGHFACRCAEHLDHVQAHGLLPAEAAAHARRILAGAEAGDLPAAVLVHRDTQWWNLIGGADGAIAALIDWDDAVAGDPADDLAMIRCIHDPAYTGALEAAYWAGEEPPPGFERRVRLHTLRNLLWKAKLRHQLGYFAGPGAAFLAAMEPGRSLEQATRERLLAAVEALA